MNKVKVILILILSLTLISAVGCSSGTTGEQETAAPTDAQTQEENTTDAAASDQTFTLEELKAYDGQNGNPAYVAVDGTVYDVTNVSSWRGGKHNGNTAGTDVTAALGNAPHGSKVLENLPVVGTLEQ